MKHKNGFNPLSRNASHRRALHRNMVTSLFKYERITTTKAKALEVRRTAEKLITRAKVDTVHNRRQAARLVLDEKIVAKLFTDIGPRMKDRNGGYTRVLKLGQRQGDAAEMAVLELVDYKFDEDKSEDNKDDEDKEEKMSEEDMMAKISDLQKSVEERDNIIMEKDSCMADMEKELAELREFKKTCMEKDKACAVESVMNEVKDFMNDEQFKALRDEGMACEFAQIDAWSNKVKAVSFEMVKGSSKKNKKDGILKFSAPVENIEKKPADVWERLKNL